MSTYHGPQGPGASRLHKAELKAEAVERNARTPPERRRSARTGCVTGKRRFITEKEAQAELVGTVIRKNRGNAKRQECRWYHCPHCGFFHLTSKPLNPPKKETTHED